MKAFKQCRKRRHSVKGNFYFSKFLNGSRRKKRWEVVLEVGNRDGNMRLPSLLIIRTGYAETVTEASRLLRSFEDSIGGGGSGEYAKRLR